MVLVQKCYGHPKTAFLLHWLIFCNRKKRHCKRRSNFVATKDLLQSLLWNSLMLRAFFNINVTDYLVTKNFDGIWKVFISAFIRFPRSSWNAFEKQPRVRRNVYLLRVHWNDWVSIKPYRLLSLNSCRCFILHLI